MPKPQPKYINKLFVFRIYFFGVSFDAYSLILSLVFTIFSASSSSSAATHFQYAHCGNAYQASTRSPSSTLLLLCIVWFYTRSHSWGLCTGTVQCAHVRYICVSPLFTCIAFLAVHIYRDFFALLRSKHILS